VVVCVGLAFAGLFEFNFGDTEVFWMMLDLYALVIASTEPPLRDPMYGRAPLWPPFGTPFKPRSSNERVPELVPQP